MTVAALAAAGDLAWLRDALSELTLRYDWDDCALSGSSAVAEWSGWLEDAQTPELVIGDTRISGALPAIRRMRGRHPEALFVPIVDMDILPTEYVQPDILPCALLWRPLNGAENRKVLLRLLQRVYSGAQGTRQERFLISGRWETRQIPYGEICCFEAREKRVFVRLREQEIPVNETITALEARLPERFFRCHKGFLVNRDHIASVDWSGQCILTDTGLTVPFSRSYRAAVKGKIHETD